MVHRHISKGDMKHPGTSLQTWDQRILKAELSKSQELTGSYSYTNVTAHSTQALRRDTAIQPGPGLRAVDPSTGWGGGGRGHSSSPAAHPPPAPVESQGQDRVVVLTSQFLWLLSVNLRTGPSPSTGSIRISDLNRFSSNMSHAHCNAATQNPEMRA